MASATARPLGTAGAEPPVAEAGNPASSRAGLLAVLPLPPALRRPPLPAALLGADPAPDAPLPPAPSPPNLASRSLSACSLSMPLRAERVFWALQVKMGVKATGAGWVCSSEMWVRKGSSCDVLRGVHAAHPFR